MLIWQRPTFTWPVAILSSAQQRFTSVFGMGTGGTTVPWSPDFGPRGLFEGRVDRVSGDTLGINLSDKKTAGLGLVLPLQREVFSGNRTQGNRKSNFKPSRWLLEPGLQIIVDQWILD